MKRFWLMSVVVILVSFLAFAAYSQCIHQLYGGVEADRRTLSVPVTIIAKLVEKVPGLRALAPDIEVTLEFNAEMEFRLDCECEPCCKAPQKQVASLSVFASVNIFGAR